MSPLAKERVSNTKAKIALVPTPSNSAAPVKRERSQLATATAHTEVVSTLLDVDSNGLEPMSKSGHRRLKGSVGKKKVAPGRARAGAKAKAPAAVGGHGQRGRKGQPETVGGLKGLRRDGKRN